LPGKALGALKSPGMISIALLSAEGK